MSLSPRWSTSGRDGSDGRNANKTLDFVCGTFDVRMATNQKLDLTTNEMEFECTTMKVYISSTPSFFNGTYQGQHHTLTVGQSHFVTWPDSTRLIYLPRLHTQTLYLNNVKRRYGNLPYPLRVSPELRTPKKEIINMIGK